jgi:hypothetical protein
MSWMRLKSYSFNRLSILFHAPAKPGIYYLHNGRRCIYINDSENIRKSLCHDIKGENPWMVLWAPNAFFYEECSEAARVEKRNKLILQFRPVITDGFSNRGEMPSQTSRTGGDFALNHL